MHNNLCSNNEKYDHHNHRDCIEKELPLITEGNKIRSIEDVFFAIGISPESTFSLSGLLNKNDSFRYGKDKENALVKKY